MNEVSVSTRLPAKWSSEEGGKGRTASSSIRKPQPPSLKKSYGSSLTVFMMACQLRLTGPSEKGMSTELRVVRARRKSVSARTRRRASGRTRRTRATP